MKIEIIPILKNVFTEVLKLDKVIAHHEGIVRLITLMFTQQGL